MLKFLLQIFWIGLLLWTSFSHAGDYKIYHDEHGAVYLEAPKSFTLVKSQYAVPMQVRPHNGLLRLYEVDGEWRVEALTEEQWRQLNLFEGSPLVAKVQLGDLDADGIADLFIGLNDQITPYLTLSQLRADMALYAARGEHSADTGANYYLSDDDGDGLYQLESSYSVYPKSAGRFRAMAMAAPVLAVGQTQGEFRVDESGAATYNLPLNIPAGIAGVQPQLSLVYNSSAGDGYMGAGWSFSGASAITRCAKNFVNDNAQGRVGFDASDRLCLDGQRLINTNAPAASETQAEKDRLYWSATSYYKELSDFTIVRPHGAASQGPKAYSVETKSGEIHYYGEVSAVTGTDTKGASLALTPKNAAGSTESGSDALFEVPGSTTARFWALKAIKDVKNNYILFKYAEDQAKGEHFLSEVHYTGQGTTAPFAKVVLNYAPALKKRIGYQAGHPASMTQLLKSITVFQDGIQYRHYQLNYFETDVLEEKTYLTSLQECTTSAIANCYPALKFDWLKPATVTTTINTVCASSDPLDCWEEATTDNYVPFSATTTLQGTSSNRYHHQMIDMNGDGFSDLVYPLNNRWNVQFGNQNGAFSTAIVLSAVGATPRTIFNISNNYLLQTIDYNGDGQRDLLVANNASSNWYVVSYQAANGSNYSCSKEAGSPKLCEDVAAGPTYLEINTGKVAYGLDGGSFVVDYDGDGLEDIVFIKDGVFQAYVNKGMSAGTHQGFEHKPLVGYLGDIDSIYYDLQKHSYTPDSKNSAMLDINGDGKTEFLLKVSVSQCDMPGYDTPGECRMEGYTWNINTVWRVYTSKSGSYTIDDEMYQDIQNVRVVDLNGDGYSDLMYQVGTSWFYRLSNGNRLMAAVNSALTTPADRIAFTYFLDLNADGRTDILLPSSTSNWTIILSRPHNYPTKIVFESRGSRSFDANAAIQFADTNGDSKLDLLTSTSDSGWKVALNSRNNIHDHRISTITTGWGVPTQIEYASLTKSGVYYRKISSNAISSDYFVPQAGYFVVNKVSTEVQTGKNLTVNYAYGGLLVHKKGRGLLGFEYLKTTDAQTAVVTETGYYQLWPYTGIPKDTLQTHGTKVLSFASNTVAQLTSATGGVFPYIKSSSEQSYSLNSGLTLSTQLSTTASSFVYDTYGNLTSSAVTISDPTNTTNKLLTNTTNTFTASTAYQRYGRLTASTVRKRLYLNDTVTSDISRSSSFTYNTDYLLETEVYSANAAASKSTTTYGYDAAGNKISVKVNAGTGAAGAAPVDRISSSTYTSNFRYLASSTDVMGQVSSYKYNGIAAASFTPALLSSITVVSPNTQSSTTNFDAFGQSISSSVKGALSGDIAVTGTVSKSFCTSCEPLFPDAYIKVVTSSVTGAEQQQFIDKYGREVGSKTKLPVSGLYSVSRKTYDTQGRPYQVFEPAIDAVSGYASTVTYDALGRAIQTTMANGGVSKVDYSGYTTTNTDALLKTKSSTANYLGQTTSTTDHAGAVLSFTYNAYGDLLTASFGGVTRVSNSYDAYGRKTAMTDVDKGSWSYVTNGFGELISQKNAKAQTTVFEYNNAGQMLRRYDPSGTVCWSYGSTAASYNVNQLVGVKQWSASNTACTSTDTPVYSESYSYNSKALVSSKTISTGGANYTTSSTYDSYGRPYELTYPSSGSITGPKIRTEYSYGAAYKTTDYSSGSAGTVYHLTTAVNARGQSTGVTYGNGVTASFSYGEDTGWLTGNTVTKAGATIQSYLYDFDDVGNVTSRQLSYGVGSSANVKETFGYDNIHRLTSRTVNSALNVSGALAMTENYSYDALGNLTSKPGVGNYSFTYDANGNVTNDSKRTFTYTAFEKPSKIQQSTDYTDFEYGPNRELIKRIDKRGSNITTTLMLDGYEQITLPTGVVEHKYSVGDAVITKRSNSTSDTYYLHKDQQGSTTAITNASGSTVQQLMYDPWGKQYVVNTSLLTYTSPAQSKGYTGHEMVNDFEVIHMGGRTYNPTLGRFMQADPFIQSPTNLQSYNRYSYVLNNPMSYTDPSGYFFKKLFSSIAKIPILDAVVKVGITIWLGPLAGALYNFAQTYTLTGSLGRGVRSGLVSFAAGLAFGAVGGSTSMGSWQNILGNALVGGLEAELQGGKFGHGFAAAGFAAFAKPMNVRMWGISEAAATARIITAAVIGGTGSVIAGGKFANGAVTGAFSQIFNGETQVKDARDAFLKKTGVTNSQLNAIFKLKLSIENLAEAISNRDKFTDLIGAMDGSDLKMLSRAVGLSEGQIDGYYRFGGDNGLRVKLDQEYRRTHMWNALENAVNAASAAQELIYLKPIENMAFKEYPDWFKKWYEIHGTISSAAD